MRLSCVVVPGIMLSAFAICGCEKEEAKSAVDKAGQSVSDAAGSAKDAASAMAEQGQKLLDQAMGYVKENKLDLAQKAIDQLDGMKASLPPSLQDGLEKTKSALAAAKAAGGGTPR